MVGLTNPRAPSALGMESEARRFYDAVTMHCRVWLALPYAKLRPQPKVNGAADKVSAACCALVAARPRIGTMDCSCWRTQYRRSTVESSPWLIGVHDHTV